jgi:hypothetical protein
MMDQVTYLHWPIGQPQYYRPCYSVFACGGPYATTIGAEPMKEHDLSKARQLVEESGYDGRPIVVLHVTDSAAQRRGNRYPPTARVDRLQRRPQGDGLVNDARRAHTSRGTRQGRLEHVPYLVSSTSFQAQVAHFRFSPDSRHIAASLFGASRLSRDEAPPNLAKLWTELQKNWISSVSVLGTPGPDGAPLRPQ